LAVVAAEAANLQKPQYQELLMRLGMINL
jgi:hypothetical protein